MLILGKTSNKLGFLILYRLHLIWKLQKSINKTCLYLKLHLLNLNLKTSILLDINILVLYFRESYHNLDKWSIARVFIFLDKCFFIFIISNKLLNRTKENWHWIIKDIINLDVINLQIIFSVCFLDWVTRNLVIIFLSLLFTPLY